MTLLQTTPKKQDLPKIRQQRSLVRGVNLRTNANVLSPASFQARKAYMVQAYQEGKFLAEPELRGKPRPNPMSDPAAMEGMMGMMKGNMAMMIPQSLIMGWINAFFSGFVISKFPSCYSVPPAMGCKAKKCEMSVNRQLPIELSAHSLTESLYSETTLSIDAAVQVHAPVWCRYSRSRREVGVQFVLVLPHAIWTPTGLQLHSRQQQWYVPSWFHYFPIRSELTNVSTAANQVTQQMAMSNPGAGMMGPEQDPDKLFLNEAENLEVLDHQWILEGIEDRLIAKFAA
jgi:hypothetical protein